MDLRTFEARLLEMIGQPAALRPFVCDGSPLDCQALIVGANPATEMKADFWDFWQPGEGFQRARWFDQYKRERQERIENGEQIELVSRTRQMIEWILGHKPTCRILETNVFPAASRTISELPTAQRVSACMELILEALTPRAIVAHGRDAQEYFEDHFRARAHIEYQDIEVHSQSVRCLFTKHLRFRSRQRALAIAEFLACEESHPS